MEVNKFWVLILSGSYLLVAVKVGSRIFFNQLKETKPKSSKTQFQFGPAQPQLVSYYISCVVYYVLYIVFHVSWIVYIISSV